MNTTPAAKRSANMRAIRSKGTKPELIVRQTVYGLGYRYRIHKNSLPGKPDLVFSKRRKVIFVNGCFWHQHSISKCLDGRLPKSNQIYWQPKLLRNVARDAENIAELKADNWKVLVVWECETKNIIKLKTRIIRFLK